MTTRATTPTTSQIHYTTNNTEMINDTEQETTQPQSHTNEIEGNRDNLSNNRYEHTGAASGQHDSSHNNIAEDTIDNTNREAPSQGQQINGNINKPDGTTGEQQDEQPPQQQNSNNEEPGQGSNNNNSDNNNAQIINSRNHPINDMIIVNNKNTIRLGNYEHIVHTMTQIKTIQEATAKLHIFSVASMDSTITTDFENYENMLNLYEKTTVGVSQTWCDQQWLQRKEQVLIQHKEETIDHGTNVAHISYIPDNINNGQPINWEQDRATLLTDQTKLYRDAIELALRYEFHILEWTPHNGKQGRTIHTIVQAILQAMTQLLDKSEEYKLIAMRLVGKTCEETEEIRTTMNELLPTIKSTEDVDFDKMIEYWESMQDDDVQTNDVTIMPCQQWTKHKNLNTILQWSPLTTITKTLQMTVQETWAMFKHQYIERSNITKDPKVRWEQINDGQWTAQWSAQITKAPTPKQTTIYIYANTHHRDAIGTTVITVAAAIHIIETNNI